MDREPGPNFLGTYSIFMASGYTPGQELVNKPDKKPSDLGTYFPCVVFLDPLTAEGGRPLRVK